jgi:hypothetical protein
MFRDAEDNYIIRSLGIGSSVFYTAELCEPSFIRPQNKKYVGKSIDIAINLYSVSYVHTYKSIATGE